MKAAPINAVMPGSIRASILLTKTMDCRVKPGHDE